jgi:hypothetical protein
MATDKDKLYYGDNLEVLKMYVKDESTAPIYLSGMCLAKDASMPR